MPTAERAVGVRLVPPAGAVRPGATLTFSIASVGDARASFGRAYTLDRCENGRWVNLPTGPFRGVGLSLGPGAERDLSAKIPADAPAGHYRISKKVRVGRDSGSGAIASSWALFAPRESGGVEDRWDEVPSFEFDVVAD